MHQALINKAEILREQSRHFKRKEQKGKKQKDLGWGRWKNLMLHMLRLHFDCGQGFFVLRGWQSTLYPLTLRTKAQIIKLQRQTSQRQKHAQFTETSKWLRECAHPPPPRPFTPPTKLQAEHNLKNQCSAEFWIRADSAQGAQMLRCQAGVCVGVVGRGRPILKPPVSLSAFFAAESDQDFRNQHSKYSEEHDIRQKNSC